MGSSSSGPGPPATTAAQQVVVRGAADPCQRLRVRFVLDRDGRKSAPLAVSRAELDPATFVDGQEIGLRATAAAVAAAIEQVAKK